MNRLFKAVQDVLAIIIFLATVMLLASTEKACAGSHVHSEHWYQEKYCAALDGAIEYRLPDRTRVDCLTEAYAFEFDFASKWAESVLQALHYARMTDKRAGVILILEKPEDERYVERLKDNIGFYRLPVDVYTVGR